MLNLRFPLKFWAELPKNEGEGLVCGTSYRITPVSRSRVGTGA